MGDVCLIPEESEPEGGSGVLRRHGPRHVQDGSPGYSLEEVYLYDRGLDQRVPTDAELSSVGGQVCTEPALRPL